MDTPGANDNELRCAASMHDIYAVRTCMTSTQSVRPWPHAVLCCNTSMVLPLPDNHTAICKHSGSAEVLALMFLSLRTSPSHTIGVSALYANWHAKQYHTLQGQGHHSCAACLVDCQYTSV